jgi:hypothetical protein
LFRFLTVCGNSPTAGRRSTTTDTLSDTLGVMLTDRARRP